MSNSPSPGVVAGERAAVRAASAVTSMDSVRSFNRTTAEMKVEVDATSGKIVEANRELWQSGKE